jgi:choline dehydrogenase-like flavoprotein
MKNDTVDVVIVGAGAAGGVVATELAHAGMRVALLERGPLPDVARFALHDELAARDGATPRTSYGPSDRRIPREFRSEPDGPFRLLHPDQGGYVWMGGVVGGGQINYAGLMWRRPPVDFQMKSACGHVAGTTLEDWPISYDELEPHYDRAEYELGVSGEGGVNPFEGKRARPFPLPPVDLQPGDTLMKATAARLGYHPFVVPLGVLTRDYRGRPACIQHPCCNGFVCEIGAKSTILSALLPAALATGNCRLVQNAVAANVTLTPAGRPDGVRYFDAAGKPQQLCGRVIVLTASATETPRLLLNSRSRRFPRGLANGNGWVGRNLMGHISPQVYGLFDQVMNEGYGPGAAIGVDDFYGKIPGLAGGGVIYSRSLATPIAFNDLLPPNAPTWGSALKRFHRDNFHRFYRLTVPAEDMPQFENRVEVSPSVRDAWGIPVARITHCHHPNDYRLFDFFREKMTALMREAGARTIYTNEPRKGGISLHQNGTCRMGNDPKTSVVNRYGQAHEADNLFVADGSIFVTSGGRNPVLTIQALAYWISAYIARQWKGGAWRL